jgi:hypothetical protein
MLEFRTLEEAKRALACTEVVTVVEELRTVGSHARMLLVERSPFTPEPIRAERAGS